MEKLSADDACLTNVNLNNVANIEEKQMCDIFDSLRKNNNLTQLSVVNCDVSFFKMGVKQNVFVTLIIINFRSMILL